MHFQENSIYLLIKYNLIDIMSASAKEFLKFSRNLSATEVEGTAAVAAIEGSVSLFLNL